MLSVAIGNYPHTRLLKERLAGSPDFDFVEVSPITKAFAQMVRQGSYDISEMAMVTFLQAKAVRQAAGADPGRGRRALSGGQPDQAGQQRQH